MVAQTRRQHLTVPVAPLAGAVAGIVAALFIAVAPTPALEDAILATGLPAILPAAAPPLGGTARLGLAMVAAGGLCLTLWFLLFLVIGSRSISLARQEVALDEEGVPVLRRADAHPDAPARRPLFASQDLGMPFMEADAQELEEAHFGEMLEYEAEDGLAIPADLDTPLAAFDPEAIRLEAPEPVMAVSALPEPVAIEPAAPEPVAVEPVMVEPVVIEPMASEPAAEIVPLPIARPQPLAPGERFETFDLSSLLEPEDAAKLARAMPISRQSERRPVDPEATVTSLLERLERSVARRREARQAAIVQPAARSIEDTLQALRDLATRAASYSSQQA